ncbi:MAG: hypothetical protein WCS76_03105 [Bacilli bacterium]
MSEKLNEKFKSRIVSAVEQRRMTIEEAREKYHLKNEDTILEWIRKYGIFDPDYTIVYKMKNANGSIHVKRLKEQLKAKEAENERMRKEIFLLKQKGIMFDSIVQVVKEDYNIDLLKKVMPGPSTSTSAEEEKEE